MHSLDSRWLLRFNENRDNRARLFVFAPAGGSASTFRRWTQYLPPQIEVCAVQLPGRETRLRETPLQQLTTLLDSLIPALVPVLDQPFAIFGHSLGALIAFEFTRHLIAENAPLPVALFVSGYHAPQLPTRQRVLHQLPDSEFLAAVIEMGGIPLEIQRSQDFLNYLLPILRADMTVFETYNYKAGEKLPVPIHALSGDQDKRVSTDELDAWKLQTSSHFEKRLFDGGHLYIRSSETELIRYILSKVQPRLLENENSK